jgi:hypothetical protein
VNASSIVLVHSPVLGPSSWQATGRALSGLGWICLVPSLLDASSVEQHVETAAAAVPEDSVLVVHSGAGTFAPAIAAASGDRIAGTVFVDARLPVTSGPNPIAEPMMLELLEQIAVDGAVPPWPGWWGEVVFDDLVPDRATADQLRAEMRALPLEFFRTDVPVPPDWPGTPSGYLRLSAAYDAEAADAEARGWTVVRADGTHVDIANSPDATAAAIDQLIGSLA